MSCMMAPPPTPCSPRQMHSHVIFLAAPHNAEAAMKTMMPLKRTGLRPQMLETCKAGGEWRRREGKW